MQIRRIGCIDMKAVAVSRTGVRVTIEHGVVTSDNFVAVSVVKNMILTLRERPEPVPDIDYAAAVKYTEIYGGRIVAYDGGMEGDSPGIAQ